MLLKCMTAILKSMVLFLHHAWNDGCCFDKYHNQKTAFEVLAV